MNQKLILFDLIIKINSLTLPIRIRTNPSLKLLELETICTQKASEENESGRDQKLYNFLGWYRLV